MADKKRRAALTTLELLRSIHEDDSDAERDIEFDPDVELHKDDCGDSESESSSDNELLVSESTNSEISDLEDAETDSETNGDHQNNITSYATSAGITWDLLDTNQNNSGRRSCHNVIREAPGPSAQAHRSIIKQSFRSAWDLFIDESMLRHIQRCTEEEARRVLQTNDWRISLHELDAFLSIVYARGAHKATKIKVHELWNKLWGIPIISETMARNRFIEIMRFLRFDYKQTRSHRLATDKLALISTIWHSFVGNCLRHYRPGTNITVDEQLFPTKARCRFTQYMPNKPDKFGIKFWMAADMQTKYMLQSFPYLGKDDSRPAGVTLGEHVVLRLIEPYKKTGRNVTTDNFFTSINLAKTLKQQGLSLVGTVNRIRKEIPQEIKKMREDLYATKVFEHDGCTLTVYQAKPTKNVLLLSTMHSTVDIGDDREAKPETVKFYNSTKFGVDVVDQMARKYTVNAASRRWPVQFFYNILDLAAINAHILYKLVTGSKISRRRYLLQLSEELGSKFVHERKASSRQSSRTNSSTSMQKTCKRKHCQSKGCTNKTRELCSSCSKLVCGKCIGKQEKLIYCNSCCE